MPCIAPHRRARILQWLELKTRRGQADQGTVLEQPLPIGGHEVGHFPTHPYVPVQPEPAIHRVDHPVATSSKLTIDLRRHRSRESGGRLSELLAATNDAFGRSRGERRDTADVNGALERVRGRVCGNGGPAGR